MYENPQALVQDIASLLQDELKNSQSPVLRPLIEMIKKSFGIPYSPLEIQRKMQDHKSFWFDAALSHVIYFTLKALIRTQILTLAHTKKLNAQARFKNGKIKLSRQDLQTILTQQLSQEKLDTQKAQLLEIYKTARNLAPHLFVTTETLIELREITYNTLVAYHKTLDEVLQGKHEALVLNETQRGTLKNIYNHLSKDLIRFEKIMRSDAHQGLSKAEKHFSLGDELELFRQSQNTVETALEATLKQVKVFDKVKSQGQAKFQNSLDNDLKNIAPLLEALAENKNNDITAEAMEKIANLSQQLRLIADHPLPNTQKTNKWQRLNLQSKLDIQIECLKRGIPAIDTQEITREPVAETEESELVNFARQCKAKAPELIELQKNLIAMKKSYDLSAEQLEILSGLSTAIKLITNEASSSEAKAQARDDFESQLALLDRELTDEIYEQTNELQLFDLSSLEQYKNNAPKI